MFGKLDKNAFLTKCTRHKGTIWRYVFLSAVFYNSVCCHVWEQYFPNAPSLLPSKINISCLCYYIIPRSPSFLMSASSLLPSLSWGLWNLTKLSIIEPTQWAGLVPNTCTHHFLYVHRGCWKEQLVSTEGKVAVTLAWSCDLLRRIREAEMRANVHT